MRRAPYAIAAAVGIAALALAGCSSGSSGGNNGQSGASASASVAAPPLADINAQPRSNLKDGGTLRDTISAMPTNWNWLTVDGNTVDLNNIYLFTAPQNWIYAQDASFKPNPNFVKSYNVKNATSSSPQVVTIDLNPQAKWNDGTPITWKDYQGTWKANNGDNTKFNSASTDGWNQIKSIERGTSDAQVVVTFKTSYPDWSTNFTTVLPAAVTASPDAFNKGWAKFNNDYGAGPYIIKSVDQAQQVVTLAQNPNWWGDKGKLDTISFRALDPSAAASAFANNELDVLSGIIDGQQYSQAATRSDADLRRAGSLQWRHYTFNTQSGALSDLNVRQAIVKAIDRQAVAASDLAGIPNLNPNELLLGNHFFMPGQKGYQDNAGPYKYNVEAAKAQLDKAGWKLAEGQTYRTKGGKTLQLTYAMMPDVSTSKNEGELLQQYLKQVGIKVNIQNVDSANFFSDTVPNGKFGITSFTWQGTNYPMANIGQIYGCGSASNFSRYCNKELQALIPKADTESNVNKRIALVNQADKLIWRDSTTLPIYRRIDITAVPKTLANFGAATFQTVPAQDIGYQK